MDRLETQVVSNIWVGYFHPFFYMVENVELIIFATLMAIMLLLIVFNRVLPNPMAIVMISSFSLIALGILMIGDGISISGTVLQDAFTEKFGLIISLFGAVLGFEVVI